MKKNKWRALFSVAIMIFAISGYIPQESGSSNTASDVVHQIEDDGAVLNDDDPIAKEPQLDIITREQEAALSDRRAVIQK